MAVQGPVIDWVADHRKHHAHTDEEGDPHSPHVGHGSGLAGLWHAHVGWLFDANGQADRRKYAPDLMEDRGMRILNRRFVSLVGLSLALPVGARLAAHRHARRRCDRAALGRAGADLLRPPRHLVDQLDLPLPRQPGASPPMTARPTSGGSRSPPSARPGTTTTTPSRARRSTACAGGSSTRPGAIIRGDAAARPGLERGRGSPPSARSSSWPTRRLRRRERALRLARRLSRPA